MRISLVFPLLAAAALRVRNSVTLIAALVVSLLSFPLAWVLSQRFDVAPLSAERTMLTLHYSAFFLLGALLARNLTRVGGWYARLPAALAGLLALASLFLYEDSGPNRVMGRLAIPPDLFDWGTAAGGLLFLVFALHSGRFRSLLNHRTVHHLGTVSYSLYLVHGTVLFTLIHTVYGHVPLLAVFGLYLFLTWGTTEIFYRLVEHPAMLLGRRLTSRSRSPSRLTVS